MPKLFGMDAINTKCQTYDFYLIFNAKLKFIIYNYADCFNAIFINFSDGIFDLKFWHKVVIPADSLSLMRLSVIAFYQLIAVALNP